MYNNNELGALSSCYAGSRWAAAWSDISIIAYENEFCGLLGKISIIQKSINDSFLLYSTTTSHVHVYTHIYTYMYMYMYMYVPAPGLWAFSVFFLYR